MISLPQTIKRLHSLQPRRVQLSKGFESLIWDRTHPVPEEDEDFIYTLITELASNVFGDDMSPYWNHKRQEQFLKNAHKIQIVIFENKTVVGWSGNHVKSFNQGKCLFFDATGILAQFQGSGVMRQLFVKDLVEFSKVMKFYRPFFIAMRTENPVIYEGLRRAVGRKNIYPIMEDNPIPQNIQELAIFLSKKLNQAHKLEPNTLIIRNAFNGPCPWRYDENLNPLLGKHLQSRDEKVNAFFKNCLDPEDSFILVMRYSLLIYTKYIILRIWEKKCKTLFS